MADIMDALARRIISSRERMVEDLALGPKAAQEGGCGVIGAVSTVPIAGRHFFAALRQMRNRGNGKGGGVAMLGLSPEYLGVSQEVLFNDYLIQIAYLDPTVRTAVEAEFLRPFFEIDHEAGIGPVKHWRDFGLEVSPPYVHRHFVRLKSGVLEEFSSKNGFDKNPEAVSDEFVFHNTYALNKKYYASLGDKKAFVLCHGKNLLVFKIVGYGEDAMRCYGLDQAPAHIWIGHHRYPTKGRLWHPGGAHPFIGLHEALVHNVDFSNYHSVSEYLAQHNIFPLFLTDTEVSVYLFDLWRRVYRYPLEYVIEALAPTTERDFFQLDEIKRRVYKEIQAAHIHGSPDGPWFFIVGLSENGGRVINLLGITDTSMLRPQVFALQDGQVQIGLIASERQAIDACLESLAEEDSRFCAKADLYWNARGGSFTDGGAFNFRLTLNGAGYEFECVDKFGKTIKAPAKNSEAQGLARLEELAAQDLLPRAPALERQALTMEAVLEQLVRRADEGFGRRREAVESLTWILDRWHLLPFGHNGRERARIETALNKTLRGFEPIQSSSSPWALIEWKTREHLRPYKKGEEALALDAAAFPAEGEDSAASFIVRAYQFGWKRVISFAWRGQRFCGCGLGANSGGFRIDAYGNPGDYLGSGLDG
ncbi:MAG: glutamate synthase, partial [Elusimicrobiota bacterium]